MKCACETGYHERFKAEILSVMDKAAFDRWWNSLPKEIREVIKKLSKEMGVGGKKLSIKPLPGAFSVTLKIFGGRWGSVAIGSNLWPQSIEWTKERVGEKVSVSICQFPNRGPMVVDVGVLA